MRLCVAHHEDVTVINSNAVEGKYRKLTSEERLDLFRRWLAGDLLPRWTPKATAWIEKMRAGARAA